MPLSKIDSAIYRPDLGTAVLEYTEGPTMGYIGLELMPIFRVGKQSGSYPVIPKEVLLKLGNVDRAPRGTYNRDDWEYERGIYATRERGREELIDDSERELFDQEAPGMADFVATERAWNYVMRAAEKRIAGMLFNTTNFTVHNVSTEWDTHSTATPIDDVNDGIISFRSACGMLPDGLVLSFKNFIEVKNTDQVVDRLKYTFPGIDINTMSSIQLAAVFGLPMVWIGGSVYDSTGKGLDTTIADVWDDEYAMLVKVSRGADLRQAGIGRSFLWTEDSPQNPIVEQYREEERRSDVFRVRHNVNEEFIESKDDSGTAVSSIYKACGYLMGNIHT